MMNILQLQEDKRSGIYRYIFLNHCHRKQLYYIQICIIVTVIILAHPLLNLNITYFTVATEFSLFFLYIGITELLKHSTFCVKIK